MIKLGYIIKKLKYQMDKIIHNVLYYIHEEKAILFRYLIKIWNFINSLIGYMAYILSLK